MPQVALQGACVAIMTIRVDSMLTHQDETARLAIAERVGQRLRDDSVPDADRRAAEELAAALARDAVERVREALALSVRHARHLPRPIALQLAHDIDSVACPFLEITEVFSDSDWKQLVLTLSHGALAAVAKRPSMPEGLAVSLAELGDDRVATNLARNKAAPMTPPVCLPLLDRFADRTDMLELLADREDLVEDVAVRLTAMVSDAARKKLVRRYEMPDHTELLGAEAEAAALLALVRKTEPDRMTALVRSLRKEGKLNDFFLLEAARERLSHFLSSAIAERTQRPVVAVAKTLARGSSKEVAALLREAGINDAFRDDFWLALSASRLSAFRDPWSTKIH